MKTLPVHLLELAAALEDHDRESTIYYFDSQSGEVVFLSEDTRGVDKRWDVISKSIDRFVPIEPMDSRKGYEIMEQFVAMLPPTRLREKLQWSLEGPKPFRRFRDTLLQDHSMRERWFEFHGESSRKIAIEWLTDHGIEPVEPTSSEYTSLLDQEAQALAEEEALDEDSDEAVQQELDDDLDEDLDEFDEEYYSEPVDLLSEEEEAELTDFVESLPEAEFNMAKLHGLLSAFAAGPVFMSPAVILALLMEFAGKQSVTDTAETQRILELLSRFYDGIIESLEAESFAPQFQQKGVMVTDPSAGIVAWCSGFMLGVGNNKASWQPWFTDVRRAKAISLIAGMAEPETLRKTEKAIGEETAWTTWTMLSELVPLIRDYWAFESALNDYLGPQPDNPQLKVGRNDPCPCGSGKKFKHCHGRVG
jgi:yecA family protein